MDGEYSVTETEILTDPIVTNGYGPVFTGIFENETGPLIALISPESNVLKVGVFSLQTGSSVSDVFTLNGARVVLGPDIQGFDENKDGYADLIIPFATSCKGNNKISIAIFIFIKSLYIGAKNYTSPI